MAAPGVGSAAWTGPAMPGCLVVGSGGSNGGGGEKPPGGAGKPGGGIKGGVLGAINGGGAEGGSDGRGFGGGYSRCTANLLSSSLGVEPFEFHGQGTFLLVTSFLSSPGSTPIPDV